MWSWLMNETGFKRSSNHGIRCVNLWKSFDIFLMLRLSRPHNVKFRKISVRKTIWDLEFSRALFLAEIFEKVRFDPYNFPITSFSARKSEQIKNFGGINRYLYLPLRYQNTFNLLCLSGFELYYRWVLLGYVCGGIMIFFKSYFKDQIKEFTLW